VAASVLSHLVGMKQEAGLATHALVKEIAVVEDMVIEQEETRSLLLPPAAGDTNLTVMLGELSRCHVQDAAPPWTVFDRLDHIPASSTALVMAAPDLSDELSARLLTLQSLGFETVVLLFGPTPRTHYPISDSGIPVWYVKREESLLELEALFG
jgi:hypothetical protein